MKIEELTRATPPTQPADGRCEAGQGAACDALADSEYIRALQRRSLENKAKNEEELYRKTVRQLGYSDYMSALGKSLVELDDGSYAVLEAGEYAEARRSGRIVAGSVDRLIGARGDSGGASRAEAAMASGE